MSILDPERRTGPTAPVHWHTRPLYPWLRLLVSLLLGTIGGAGMYIVVVVLPVVQAEFGTARMGASLPYTMNLIGFSIGSITMGMVSDRFRVVTSVLIGVLFVVVGFLLAADAPTITIFAIGSFVIGIGNSATFAPLVADIAIWFERRRGLAVAIASAGNYLAGAFWPTLTNALVEAYGWRTTYVAIGLFSLVSILALVWVLRPAPPALAAAAARSSASPAPGGLDGRPLGMTPNQLQALLCIAGVGCCVAMSMPQVHIVALCADLGYGSARGAEMLSLMLGSGIISRLLSGWISDHIGGARTLLLGATLQAIALALFLPNQSLDVLRLVSILFGLFQGGIVPAYAMIVREHFPARQAGTRVGVVITATLLGMAFGGWASGAIFDWTGSYDAAFLHGIAWNLVTIAIALLLVDRSRRRLRLAAA
ncbi:MAG: MFS transporter [Alphaproteobacteria bacterium]|nr:MFS transporter [Alphaproteobacteria bacterium]